MTTQPLTDEQQLVARIAEAIRPRMLIGLQDAELYDEPGAERINEWADSIANWAADVAQAELDRLRAENEAMRAIQRVQTAGFEAALLIPDRDPGSAASSGAWHEAIGYNDALSAVRDAIAPAAAPTT